MLFGLPLFEGRAIDRSQAYGQIPVAWRSAIAGAQRDTPADRRIMLAPGALFGFYRWGNTVSSVGPALSERPLIVRELVPYATSARRDCRPRWTTSSNRATRARTVRPLAALMAVGEVIVTTPTACRSRAARWIPSGRAQPLVTKRGFAQPQAPGAGRSRGIRPGRAAPERLPELRTYRVPGRFPASSGSSPDGGATVLDGDAEGIAELAAVGGLRPDRALLSRAT